MKKIIIALALIGLTYSGAEAQTKSPAAKTNCTCASAKKGHVHKTAAHKSTSTSGDTYQVCREKGGHYECCIHRKTVTKVAAK